jgi:hypothetical protein
MAPTYELIASNTLTTDTASVTFSSIPATYTDLVVRLSARSDTSGYKTGYIKFNADAGSNYSTTILRGNGSAASSARTSSANQGYCGYIVGTDYTSNTFSNNEVYIPSYTANQNKPVSIFSAPENNATTAEFLSAWAWLWRDTAAITSIELYPNSDDFASGSSFFLYGIKNS